jgi:RNA polymerase sigma-70 factor (ECF subfamily)
MQMSVALAAPPALPDRPGTATMAKVVDLSIDTDGDLLRRIGNGDGGAFEQLYRRYARPVFGLALRRLGDRGRAEDAVQETFTAVWRSARTYHPERGPGAPWLYAVARNAIVDRARGRIEPPAEAPDTPALETGPAERAEEAYQAWRVHCALETLPEKERKVLELAYWHGLSQSEIAAHLAIPLGTVKTRTRSALGKLADLLEDELREPAARPLMATDLRRSTAQGRLGLREVER